MDTWIYSQLSGTLVEQPYTITLLPDNQFNSDFLLKLCQKKHLKTFNKKKKMCVFKQLLAIAAHNGVKGEKGSGRFFATWF